MFKDSILLAAVFVGAALASVASAQAPVPSPDAALHARVAILEAENARLQGDYRILLTASCPASSPAPPAVAPPFRLERAVAAGTGSPDPVDRAEQRRQDRELDDAAWSVSAVESRIAETNAGFARIAWKVTIKNDIGRPQAFDFVVQFLDKDGFVVDTADLSGETVAALTERTIAGDKQVKAPGGLRVTHIKAVATRKTR
jgi:hypothetical protein